MSEFEALLDSVTEYFNNHDISYVVERLRRGLEQRGLKHVHTIKCEYAAVGSTPIEVDWSKVGSYWIKWNVLHYMIDGVEYELELNRPEVEQEPISVRMLDINGAVMEEIL